MNWVGGSKKRTFSRRIKPSKRQVQQAFFKARREAKRKHTEAKTSARQQLHSSVPHKAGSVSKLRKCLSTDLIKLGQVRANHRTQQAKPTELPQSVVHVSPANFPGSVVSKCNTVAQSKSNVQPGDHLPMPTMAHQPEATQRRPRSVPCSPNSDMISHTFDDCDHVAEAQESSNAIADSVGGTGKRHFFSFSHLQRERTQAQQLEESRNALQTADSDSAPSSSGSTMALVSLSNASGIRFIDNQIDRTQEVEEGRWDFSEVVESALMERAHTSRGRDEETVVQSETQLPSQEHIVESSVFEDDPTTETNNEASHSGKGDCNLRDTCTTSPKRVVTKLSNESARRVTPKQISFTCFEENLLGVVELSFLGDDGSVGFMDLLLKRRSMVRELPQRLANQEITDGFLEVLQVSVRARHCDRACLDATSVSLPFFIFLGQVYRRIQFH